MKRLEQQLRMQSSDHETHLLRLKSEVHVQYANGFISKINDSCTRTEYVVYDSRLMFVFTMIFLVEQVE